MKFKLILVMMLAAICFASCSNDDDVSNAKQVEATYKGYTSAVFKYSSTPIVTDSEAIVVKASSNNIVNVTLISKTWGTALINNAAVVKSDRVYTVSGSGTITMTGHTGGTSSYDCTLVATIKTKTSATYVITIPSLMGGTVVTFSTGSLPSDE